MIWRRSEHVISNSDGYLKTKNYGPICWCCWFCASKNSKGYSSPLLAVIDARVIESRQCRCQDYERRGLTDAFLWNLCAIRALIKPDDLPYPRVVINRTRASFRFFVKPAQRSFRQTRRCTSRRIKKKSDTLSSRSCKATRRPGKSILEKKKNVLTCFRQCIS